MNYELFIKPRGQKDLKKISNPLRDQIMESIDLLKKNLRGDVKRLTDHQPRYRLRVGDYRVYLTLKKIESKSIA